MAGKGIEDLLAGDIPGKVAGEPGNRLNLGLALPDPGEQAAEPGGKPADHEGNDDIAGKRGEVTPVVYRQGVVGLDEDEVECKDACDGRKQGGPPPEEERGHDDRQELEDQEELRLDDTLEEDACPPGGGYQDEGYGVVPGEEVRDLPVDGDTHEVAFRLVEEDVDAPGPAQNPVDRGEDDIDPPGLPEHDHGDIVPPGVAEDLVGDILTAETDNPAPEPPPGLQRRREPGALPDRERSLALQVHREHHPVGIEPGGKPVSGPHHLAGCRARPDPDQEPFGCRPGARDGAGPHMADHLQVGGGRHVAQGELPQGEEVSGAEEPAYRRLGHIPDIDLPCPEAEPQLLRGDVDEPDLVGAGDERIRERL